MLLHFDDILNTELYILVEEENEYVAHDIMITEDFDVAESIIEEFEPYDEILPQIYHGLIIPADVLDLDIYKHTQFIMKIPNLKIESVSRNIYNISGDLAILKGALIHSKHKGWTQDSLKTEITSVASRYDTTMNNIFLFLGYRFKPVVKISLDMVDEEKISSAQEITAKIEQLRYAISKRT